MPWGGKRTGAGAPKGNLNAFKNGGASQQLKQALSQGTPQGWENFLARMPDDSSKVRARVIAALLLIRARHPYR